MLKRLLFVLLIAAAAVGCNPKPACDFVLPANYCIVSDGKVFYVRYEIFKGSYEYLSRNITYVWFDFPNGTPPTEFKDECHAKGALKDFLETAAEKRNPATNPKEAEAQRINNLKCVQ